MTPKAEGGGLRPSGRENLGTALMSKPVALSEPIAHRLRIPQQPPRQDALADQLTDLHILAARVGMYDAADWLWKQMRA